MKLLKLIANLGYGSRKEVTAMFRAGRIADADGRVLSIERRRSNSSPPVDARRSSHRTQLIPSNSALRTRTNHHTPALPLSCNGLLRKAS